MSLNVTMFKKSRIKIIFSIMISIIVILFGTLAIIYITSYARVSKDNQRMLEQYARDYHLNGSGDGSDSGSESSSNVGTSVSGSKSGSSDADASGIGGNNGVSSSPDSGSTSVPPAPSKGDVPSNSPKTQKPDNAPPDAAHKYDVSTFYSVAIADDGTVLRTDNEMQNLYSDEILEQYAAEIISNGSKTGVNGSLAYRKTEKKNYVLVSFIDNVVMQGSMATLFQNTLIFGTIAIIIVFVISIFLSRRIVSPLEESYQKQKQFISDAGHELKTPIAVVSANAELLEREIGENKWLSNIQYENERMGSLVRQLLELARTENVAPSMEKINMSRLTAGELLPFESVAYENNIQLSDDIADNVYLTGDSTRLKQLVSILIDNAIRHSENGNSVKLTLKTEHNNVRLSVINDGKEIPLQQQKQIFERFYRVDEARNSDDRHFGLGLAIAKAITVSHKGKISVSCYDGKVEFIVLLPILNK